MEPESTAESPNAGDKEFSRRLLKKRLGRPASSYSSSANEDSRMPSPAFVKEKPVKAKGPSVYSNSTSEKMHSLEDAVYIYTKLRDDGTRPPLFLLRNLSYLPRPKSKLMKPPRIDTLVRDLLNHAQACQQIKFTVKSLINLPSGSPAEKAETLLKFYLQKHCFKRRKTDITVKERELFVSHVEYPIGSDSINLSFVLDINEICSDVGSHHLSACYLKSKVLVTTRKSSKLAAVFVNGKRGKKRVVETETRCRNVELAGSLLLFSGGKTYLNNGTQTMYLYSQNASHTRTPYVPWDELSRGPQLIVESKQMAQRRAGGRSPLKVGNKSEYKPNSLTPNNGLTPNGNTNTCSPSEQPACSDKVYLVMPNKGAPQVTVQTGYNCPFCLRKTQPAALKYLLKHLTLCHDRLIFIYKESDASVLVSVNNFYDGSYCGNPHDVLPKHRQDSLKNLDMVKNEPRRRTPYTEIINLRCNKKPVTLEEFTKYEPLVSMHTTAFSGHNRLYFHSVSNQVMLPNDFDYDSDGEDLDWTRTASSRLIDEFIDVNKGEKELMKIWNLFMSKNPQIICDNQVETACLQFIEEHCDILSIRLRNNFLCHIATMYDCGVLHPRSIANILRALPHKKTLPAINGFNH